MPRIQVYVFSLKISSELKRNSLAEEFKESITSVIILAHEYISLKSVRTERQIEKKLKRVGSIIQESEGRLPIEIIISAFESLNNAFMNLKSIYAEYDSLIKENADQKKIDRNIYIEEAMTTLIFVEAYKIKATAALIATEASNKINDLYKTGLFLVTAFLLLLTVIIGALIFFVSRRINFSLNHLTRSANAIEKGKLNEPVPNLGIDEFGDLASAFDSMRISLKQNEEEIHQLNQTLEQRVIERTKELEAVYMKMPITTCYKKTFIFDNQL